MFTQTPPRELFSELETFDYSPVRRTLKAEFGIDDAAADGLLAAFLQWFSVIPSIRPGHTFVMLKTDVDRVFHSFIL